MTGSTATTMTFHGLPPHALLHGIEPGVDLEYGGGEGTLRALDHSMCERRCMVMYNCRRGNCTIPLTQGCIGSVGPALPHVRHRSLATPLLEQPRPTLIHYMDGGHPPGYGGVLPHCCYAVLRENPHPHLAVLVNEGFPSAAPAAVVADVAFTADEFDSFAATASSATPFAQLDLPNASTLPPQPGGAAAASASNLPFTTQPPPTLHPDSNTLGSTFLPELPEFGGAAVASNQAFATQQSAVQLPHPAPPTPQQGEPSGDAATVPCTDGGCRKGKRTGGKPFAQRPTGECWVQGDDHHHNKDPNDKTYSKSEGSWCIGMRSQPNMRDYIKDCKERKKYKERHETAIVPHDDVFALQADLENELEQQPV